MKKKIIRYILFLFVSILLFQMINNLFLISDKRNYQWIKGFYEERENSLDVVLIGGSNIYAFWEAPIAWNNYGITSWSYTCNSMPFIFAEDCIKEARKTQPNAIFLVGLNSFYFDEPDSSMLHWLLDYMPPSDNKNQIIMKRKKKLIDFNVLEYYFPVIRFHSRWEELGKDDFIRKFENIKGASHYKLFLNNVKDCSKDIIDDSDARLSEKIIEATDSLISYCESEKINIVFWISPQFRNDKYIVNINELQDYIASKGYDIINTLDKYDSIGLDIYHDFYNSNHTNIHGAVKTTDYIARYLVDKYKLNDKRKDGNYCDWNEAYEKYVDILSTHALPFEYQGNKRDYSLDIPKLLSSSDGKLEWLSVKNCQGYGVYAKEKGKSWKLIAKLDNQNDYWTDNNYSANKKYTIVAFSKKGKKDFWGQMDINNNG